MNTKRIKAAVIAAATALTALASILVMNVSATQMTFLQGDVNGDGNVNTVDSVFLSEYLLGTVNADENIVTRMDVDENEIIDMYDVRSIQNFCFGLSLPTYITVNTLLTNINNEERTYWKHDCSSSNPYSYTQYVLNSNQNRSRAIPGIDNEIDDEEMNKNVVKIRFRDSQSGENGLASGFIVDDHVIATAAHAVTDYGAIGEDNSFSSNIKVYIYSDEGETLLKQCNAKYVHVPKDFMDYSKANSELRRSYDYALIYVEEDLTEYGICNIGYMTDEFMQSGTKVVTSGFTSYDNGESFQRYYSAGRIEDFTSTQNENKTYRYKTVGYGHEGKSGGPSYYERTVNGNTTKVVIGIYTHGGINDYNGVNYGSRGVRITPTIARFWLNNEMIN